jgi:DNA-binding NtrC family response regulator
VLKVVDTLRVLLIEDDEAIRTTLVETLLEHGIDADGLANGEDALVLLGAGQVPDVLVTDIDLGPGLDGIDLAGTAQTDHPDVGVVFISGTPKSLQAHRLGPHEEFLLKPFTIDSLARSIRAAADRKHESVPG